MARTPSNMIPIGFNAPDFELYDTKSKKILKSENIFGEKCTLLMFICNHCPFVIHVIDEIIAITALNENKNIGYWWRR